MTASTDPQSSKPDIIPPPTEEMLVIDGFWERKGQFSLRISPRSNRSTKLQGNPHTYEDLGSTNWVVRKMRVDLRGVGGRGIYDQNTNILYII